MYVDLAYTFNYPGRSRACAVHLSIELSSVGLCYAGPSLVKNRPCGAPGMEDIARSTS